MSERMRTNKTTTSIKVKDLPPKKATAAKVKGGSDAVMTYRSGSTHQHNETLLLDTGGFAR